MKVKILFLVSVILFGMVSCSKDELNTKYFDEIKAHRTQTDSLFRYSDSSPFKKDTSVKYEGLKWFEINPEFVFKSKLHKYEQPETVIVLGTKGEERNQIKYAWFQFKYHDNLCKINVYKYREADITPGREMLKNYLAVWFRDKTTGIESYEVGRYLEIEEEASDPNHLYTLDFNKAYNPYCAYTPIYSCAIPRKEDYLDLRITAGEKKYQE